jgi:hypothetical protein
MTHLLVVAEWQMVEYTTPFLATLFIQCETCEERAIDRFAVVENHGRADLVHTRWAEVCGDRKALVDVF